MNKKEDNKYIIKQNYCILQVQYKKIWYDAYIDIEDIDKVKMYHWRANHKKNKVYIITGSFSKGTAQYLHNFLMNYIPQDKMEIDHIDGNSLNNQKDNLRLVTRQQNIDNTKVRIDNQIGIRGIAQDKKSHLYKCDFSFHGKRYYFKDWKTIEEAVYCRKYAEEYFGIETLNKNFLANQYLTLSQEQANKIKQYVHNKISGN